MKPTPITPIPPSPTSSGTSTAPPSARLPLESTWSLEKTRQPSQEPLRPSQQTAWKDAISLGPAGTGFYPCPPWKLPTLETTRPEPPVATPHPLDLPVFSCHHPTPTRAVRPAAWPCSPLPLSKAQATLPWPPPSSPPPTPPRLRKDRSSPRSLGDDSLSFRFRLT